MRAPDEVRRLADSIFRKYREKLHSFIRRRLTSHPSDVDDVSQEVFLRLLKCDREKLIEKPEAYVYGIASHVVSKVLRDERRDQARVSFTSEPLELLEERVPIDPRAIDETADRLNLRRQLLAAIRELPRDQARVLLMLKRKGMTYEEVARRMGVGVKTVEHLFCQAKARLAERAWDR